MPSCSRMIVSPLREHLAPASGNGDGGRVLSCRIEVDQRRLVLRHASSSISGSIPAALRVASKGAALFVLLLLDSGLVTFVVIRRLALDLGFS